MPLRYSVFEKQEVIMVRGCQKKIIYLKNTQSNIFEEAYFVIKEEVIEERSENDMVEEANRILNENFDFEVKKTGFKIICCFFKKHAITFLCGGVSGILITLFF